MLFLITAPKKTKQKQDLRDGFPVPNIMFLLPKQLKTVLWVLYASLLAV